MNIDQLIDEMEVYIDNCKTTGMLSGGSMIKVNREELLAMLDELRAQVASLYGAWRGTRLQLDRLLADAADRERRKAI